MPELINMIGKKFGKLIVIKRNYPNSKEGQPKYLCKCDCGKETVVRGYCLRRGSTKSCGCLKEEFAGDQVRLTPGFANMRLVVRNYKRRAIKQGREYNLTLEQFAEITQKDCYYCGAKPNNINNKKDCNGKYIYNGIDRIDNTKGYTMGNIVPCCRNCNAAKGTLTLREFQTWVDNIYNNMFKKERK